MVRSLPFVNLAPLMAFPDLNCACGLSTQRVVKSYMYLIHVKVIAVKV